MYITDTMPQPAHSQDRRQLSSSPAKTPKLLRSTASDGTGVAIMATIFPFIRGSDGVFDPKDIAAMSTALDDICKELNLRDNAPAREVMAVRIIDLAKTGERSPTRLRDRVLHEARMAGRVNWDDARPA
jgi:hypothetical protein